VAVLEGQGHTEVALQAAPDRVAGQRAQQLAAFLLGRRRGLVVGEPRRAVVEFGGEAGDEAVGVRKGRADRVHEVRLAEGAVLGFGEELRGDVERHEKGCPVR